MKPEKAKINKPKWSKKKKILYAVNIAMVVIIICTIMFRWAALGIPPANAFSFFLIQVAFTIFTLIVYYLSIIADAVSGKRDKNDKQNK